MLTRCLILLLGAALAAPAFAGGWGSHYHYGHGYGYGGHLGGHYSHHGGGDGTALLAGLVIGGLVGWLINEDRHHYGHRVYRGEPGYRYDPPRYRDYGYAPRRYRRYARVAPRTEPADAELAGERCRMTREYTTTLEIDGAQREAYGTKCLTADGSWMLGRPKLVPAFD